MGLGLKVFFVLADDGLKQIPFSRFERLTSGCEPMVRLPEFADQAVRYALVVLRFEERKPKQVRRVDYGILKFDGYGAVDLDHEAKAGRLMIQGFSPLKPPPSFWAELGIPQIPNVIEARPVFARRRYRLNHTWEPGAELEHEILSAALRGAE